MKVSKLLVVVAGMSISALTFGAGLHGDSHEHGHATASAGHEHSHGMAGGEPAKASEAGRTIKVTMYDNYYEPASINVEPGEIVRFVIANEGVQVHEFNIGTAAMHAAHQDEMMTMVEHGVIQGGKLNHDMMDMDMGDGQSMKHDDPNSVLLGAGESGEIVWKFSGEGEIEFACNVPGHYQSGMHGDVSYD